LSTSKQVFPVADRFVATAGVVPAQLPDGRVVTGTRVGAYAGIAATYAGMCAWAIANGLNPADDMWEVHLTDPERESNPEPRRSSI
jgi:hypothetical protein